MEKLKFELGQTVKIKTSYNEAIILERGHVEGLDGGKHELYLCWYGGERRGYFSNFELEALKPKS